ncbi:MAG TPA: AI-2E family transporter [Polyangiaceae bacterium]|nr:AI-2E family transporter [Polyangiaceae bacterium]
MSDFIPEEDTEQPAGRERRALEWFAVAALAAIVWLTIPVAAGILLGALMGFTLQPFYEVLVARLGRPTLASLLTVIGSALAIVGTVLGFGTLFIARGVALTRSLLDALGPHGALSDRVHSLQGLLPRLGISVDYLTQKLRDAVSEIASLSASVAEATATATAAGLLGLFFALLTMHLILRNWAQMANQLEVVSPLRPQYTRALLAEFQRVGRATLLGTVVTGIAQGVFATIGFWICGAPEPVFFGIATAVASLIPGVGTLLVWVPVGIFLTLTGHVAGGISELVWGAATVVGVSDYVIRPRLVGDEAIPTLITFVALFGGVEVLGLKGLVTGPVVMSVAVAILRIYVREARAAREGGPPPSLPGYFKR